MAIKTYHNYPGLPEGHSIFRVTSWVNDMLTRVMRYGPSDYVERLANASRIYRRRFQASNRPRPGNRPLYPNESYFQSWLRQERLSNPSSISKRQRRKMKRALSEMQTYYDKYEPTLSNTYWASHITIYIDNLKSRLARTRYDGRVDSTDIIDSYAALLNSSQYDNDKIGGEYRYRTTDDGERKLWRSEKGFAVSYNFNNNGKAERVSWGGVNRLQHIDIAQRRVKADLSWELKLPQYQESMVQYVAPTLDDDIPF